MKTVQEMERAIIRKLVEDALYNGYTVVHNDGEENTCHVYADGSYDVPLLAGKIMDEIQATDEEYLIFYVGESKIGWVMLVYGNSGWDVVADHTATTEMEKLLSGAMALADKLESESC